MDVLLHYCPHCDGKHLEKGEYVDNHIVIKGNIVKKYNCSCGELATVYLIHVQHLGFSYIS